MYLRNRFVGWSVYLFLLLDFPFSTLFSLRAEADFRRECFFIASFCSWQIVTEMKESEQKLQVGAQTLECTMHGVLREQHLEKYIAPQHWESLMNGPVQVGLPEDAQPMVAALAEATVQSLTCLQTCAVVGTSFLL